MTDTTRRAVAEIDAQLDEASSVPLWLDTSTRPAPRPPLGGDTETDLVIVGGGFTGLWTALRAKERDPQRRVLLLEADRIAEHATGRNGGFCEASLTHGEPNGRDRWPDEYEQLDRLGRENLAEIAATVQRYGIDCDFRRDGMLAVATREHEVADLEPGEPGFLDAAQVRAMVDSPTYLAGREEPDSCALVDPARLAWGLADAVESFGVRIAEHTRVEEVARRGGSVTVRTSSGIVTADRVVLATNAFRPLLARLRLHTVPVYDYVLATEPLTQEQLTSIGWQGRQGIGDSGNQFHYYRLTADNRIVWGGYDAIYHFGRRIDPALDDRRATHRVLAEHFYETFPQLSDVRFTHRWGGVIDTCTRFSAFFGSAFRGRVAYALGFTGLGVGASRFAADVMLDLLDGATTERTRLQMVRRRPLPFPPEPLAFVGIQLTRWSLARADRTGRRNAWLRVLDRLGLGFDS
ncbi:FAD-dependent oxidoreductase [Blastococcus sp. BMG 814]|uniref:FAD-dependent oxidoreductase n=1 Tax=Blastococcus carthaginiensis TaxID=3050034 RepID=A0ABT9IDF9_9ACTN|nr:FAD-dependent oxidoreductase [Blastococcus carthaginiensis]MDP5183623.1 FAD-dependent oxidoreductase [Blastococcus carthaginiensis]